MTAAETSPRPNFFIVGAPRCGTTAMYEYLRQHPDVFMPYRKEPVYFGTDLSKRRPYLDEAGYLELFGAGAGRRRIGEATVWYLYSTSAADEIKAFSPSARIIIMLRNPVDMIHSLHSHWLFTANEDVVDFGEALALEPERLDGRRLPRNVRRPEGLQYRALGRYSQHVQRYLEVFGRQAVKIIIYDDLQADPRRVYRDTLEYLELDADFQPTFDVVNRNKGVRSAWLRRMTTAAPLVNSLLRLPAPVQHKIRRALLRANMKPEARPPMSAELRAELTRYFTPDIRQLAALIERDLSGWTTVDLQPSTGAVQVAG